MHLRAKARRERPPTWPLLVAGLWLSLGQSCGSSRPVVEPGPGDTVGYQGDGEKNVVITPKGTYVVSGDLAAGCVEKGRPLHGLDDRGMRVAEDERAVGADVVDVGVSVDVHHAGAGAESDDRRITPDGAEGAHRLGEAVQRREAAAVEEDVPLQGAKVDVRIEDGRSAVTPRGGGDAFGKKDVDVGAKRRLRKVDRGLGAQSRDALALFDVPLTLRCVQRHAVGAVSGFPARCLCASESSQIGSHGYLAVSYV